VKRAAAGRAEDRHQNRHERDSGDGRRGRALPRPPRRGSAAVHVTRSLALPAGDYDLYVALKERPRGDDGRDKGAAAPKITVMKQALVVPDYWNGEMSTSSVFVADKVSRSRSR